MTPLIGLYRHAADIAFGAPQVITHRLQRMGPGAVWSPATALEAQLMVTEKAQAMAECWLAWSAALWAPSAWALWSASPWTAASGRRRHAHAVRSASRMLAPLSTRVNANVKRLSR